MQTDGLSLDQAPPLSIPTGLFLTAPLSVVAAGLLLIAKGPAVMISGYAPWTLLLAHLGTIGFLTMVMIGAFYQMAPVVASAPVPRIRLAHLVHALLLIGLVLLGFSLLGVIGTGIQYAFYFIWTGLMLFLGQVGPPLLRTQTKDETVQGMRLALVCLFLTATLGSAMAHVFKGSLWLGPRGLWLQVHLGAGLLGWVGGLLVAVSWQVVPMFYLTDPPGRRARQLTLALILIGVTLPILVLLLERAGLLGAATSSDLAAWTVLPAVLAVWVLHPIQTFRSLIDRRRRRVDASLYFWMAGLTCAPLTALAGIFELQLIFAWLAVWGWAGLIIHGMLTRIVPFLVWFHRFSPLVGLQPTPSVRSLLPNRWSQLNLLLHVSSLIAGVIAIWTHGENATLLTGLLLAATGLSLLLALLRVVRQRPALS